jgi:hypothetical protein
MSNVIAFPAERRSRGTGLAEPRGDGGSVVILPVIRVERGSDNPTDGFEPQTSSPRGRRRKR